MIRSFVRWLRGYVRLCVAGYSPERFLNMCCFHQLFIWGLEPTGKGYGMYMSISDFRKLKPLVRKTHTKVTLEGRYGFPFFLARYRKRKLFFAGLFLCAVLLRGYSLFIWDIHFEGNVRYPDTTLAEFLESEGVAPAMLRSLDLFWPRGQKPPHSEEVVPITATLLRSGSQAAYFAGWNYRGEDRTLYITNVGGTTCAANAALQVIAVNLDTKAETVYPLTNQTGVTLAGRLAGSLSGQTLSLSRRVACPLGGYVYNGYLYMRSQNQEGGAYRYFRIALDDAGDVEEVACNGDQMPYVHDAYGGRMYSYTGNGSPDHGVVLDTARNCLLRHEAFSSSATYNKRYDIRGRSILQLYCKDTGTGTDGVGLSLRPNYLATVNNLGETVQKTADQTMKVTYTLTRLSG